MTLRIQITLGNGTSSSYVVQRNFTRIGSSQECDLVIGLTNFVGVLLTVEKPEDADCLKLHCNQSDFIRWNHKSLRKGDVVIWKHGETLMCEDGIQLLLEAGKFENRTAAPAIPKAMTHPSATDEPPPIISEEDTANSIDSKTGIQIGVIVACVLGFIVIALAQLGTTTKNTDGRQNRYATYEEVVTALEQNISGSEKGEVLRLFKQATIKENQGNRAGAKRDYEALQERLCRIFTKQSLKESHWLDDEQLLYKTINAKIRQNGGTNEK